MMAFGVKSMKAMSLRNIPDDIYRGLQEMARSNRRSLQEQTKYLLEQEVKLRQGSYIIKAAAWRNRLKNRNFSDTVADIREDRQR